MNLVSSTVKELQEALAATLIEIEDIKTDSLRTGLDPYMMKNGQGQLVLIPLVAHKATLMMALGLLPAR